ncbi:hypothetical protein A8139_21475 [Marinomonas primoryensis]|uniref:Uncharacterized protein n=1 Tax=Marinomonas primoryensis TaxID=178399 RepID=A0A2Z4PX53_9GAMM|nr:hypothetical protein [Marinomonas primoryensis]AWX98701.1 hypothetical protein A8139_00860 [Marinomonas primoryensis]AWY02222.1 hypothetical protein A8139_21475 [Marinomonas primoryensis]
MKKEHMKLALSAFETLMNECESESEITEISCVMATLCIKTVHGIEGQKFKEGFLSAAIADKEMIKPLRVQVQ